MNFNQYLHSLLEKLDVSEAEFQDLIIRLLNYSVIVRNESQTEEILFDRLIRCQQLVEDYLSIMGIRLLLDTRFEYARIYPPSSDIPGIKEADDNAWNGSLRNRLSQYEVALVLVIRAQYEKALREGKIDENGYALDSIESITIAAKNLLGRNLPEKLSDRKKLFIRLRQLKLIEYRADEAFETNEGWIKIHPMIITFVSHSAVDSLEINVDQSTDNKPDAIKTFSSERSDLQADKIVGEEHVS